MADDGESPKTLQIAEVSEGEIFGTNDYFFCKVGDSIPITSGDAVFDTNNIPLKPLAISPRFGLIFAAHSSGFCMAKTKDVIDAAKEIKEKGSGCSVQELSVVGVDIGRVSILALSTDSSYILAVVGKNIHCFSLDSLLEKDQKPIFSCSVESDYVKDMLWIKEEPSYIVLTDTGKLYVGAIHKPLTGVLDEIDAVEKSADGNFIVIGRKNNIRILSSQFKEISHFVLPESIGDDSVRDTVKVDSIRWVRSDSIAVGRLQQTEDGQEENYFVQVIMSEDGKSINDVSKLAAVDFSDLFPGIVDDIVPFGCGPHLFMTYLENCEFAFVSNRKNTDQHIMLLSWSQGDNRVAVVDIERDSWLPRIDLQENGDDNLILGLCVDNTSIYENVKVKIGVEEMRELQPHCLLVCLTLEGKLVMFNVASIAGSHRSSQALSAVSGIAQNNSTVPRSNLGEVPAQHDEEGAKHSGSDVGSHELNTNKISSALDEVSVTMDPTSTEKNNLFTPKFNDNMRKEPIPGNNGQKALVDLRTSKPFGHPERLPQETSSPFLLKNSRAQGFNAVAGDIVGVEKLKTECMSSLTDNSPGKSLASTDKDVAEKMGFSFSRSTSKAMESSSSLGTGISNTRPSNLSPSLTESTLSGNSPTNSDTAITGSFLGNFGSRSSDSSNSSIGKAVNYSQKATFGSSFTEMPLSIPGSKVHSREGITSQNSMGHSLQTVKGNNLKSSPFGQLDSEHNLSKQFGNVQNMAKELDKLLECIEEEGGFSDICTTAHRRSLEALEEGMNSLSERSRVWQSVTEERIGEIELLLDKTVQVLARKTHMDGIVRQTTDGQYWDLWNRQKLSSELDQKQQNIFNLSQDLVNRMIELEKHFNALELNLFGESTGSNFVSRALHISSATSRYSQSLHAIHNAMISQLAAAQHLSDFLSGQMAMLSIKSPLSKQTNIKKQVFESIGIPYPDDNLASPNTVTVFDSPSNKHSLVSYSGATHNGCRRNQLSGRSGDLETARRRRDSLDRNWAKYEAPKTTVKRMLVQNERQNVSGLCSSMDKQFVTPCKVEGSTATQPKVLGVQDWNGGKGTAEKLNSDTMATSVFKWAGSFPEMSQAQAEQSSRLSLVPGNRFPAIQNTFASPSSSPSSSSLSSFMDSAVKENRASAERARTQIGNFGKFESAFADLKPSGSQFGLEKPTTHGFQLQPLSSSVEKSLIPISYSKENELTKPVDSRSSSILSTGNVESSSTSESPPVSTSSGSAFPLPTLSVQALPIAPVEGGSTTNTKMVKDVSQGDLQYPSSAFSVSSLPAAPVNTFSSVDPRMVDTNSEGSSMISAKDPLNIVSQPSANKLGSEMNLPTSSQPPQKLVPFVNDGSKSESLTPASIEVPKSSGNAPGLSNIGTLASDVASNAPEKQSTSFTLPLVSLSDSGVTADGKNRVHANVTQEDEMEEEAPETNQVADLSLGSFSGFGMGSTVSSTAPNSNPFGVSISSTPPNMSSSISLTVPPGQLFRPASFSFQSLQASQQSQSPNVGATSAAFSSAAPQQPPAASGFGQPGQIGFGGQQVLGSVLGSFGQSRQIGAGLPGSGFGGSPSSGGGFLNAASGGFGSVSTIGGGFAGMSAASGGFAGIGASAGGFAAAAPTSGGFAAAAPSGGFAAAAPSGGGFGAVATGGGGFAAAAGGGGGFGAFSKQGAAGFSALGAGTAGGRQPPSELFTQIRR